jgi:hypothetical protein
LGALFRKPTSQGAVLTVFIGALTGIVLNLFPKLMSWEMATLIETLICLAIFFISGYVKAPSKEYYDRVTLFFKQIRTPIAEHEKPTIEPRFKWALNGLFAVSLAVSGLLFIVMSIPSIHLTSGWYSLAAGLICMALAAIMWFSNRKPVEAEKALVAPLVKKPEIV